MKRKFIILILLFLSSLLFGQNTDSSFYVNTAFKGGEILKYKIRYGLIKGGEASMRINTVPVGDTYVFHIKAVAQTTGIVGAMVTIKDIYESYVDIFSGYPIKSVRNIREHNYRSYNEVLFFREQGYLKSVNSGKHKAPNNVLDVLSAFYFARRYLFSNKLKKNQTIDLYTFFDEHFFPIKAKFKKIEKTRTKFGKIKCLKFVPILGDKSPFKKEEDFEVWVTADDNFVPVKIRVKLPIGSLKCDIIDFGNLKNPNANLRK